MLELLAAFTPYSHSHPPHIPLYCDTPSQLMCHGHHTHCPSFMQPLTAYLVEAGFNTLQSLDQTPCLSTHHQQVDLLLLCCLALGCPLCPPNLSRGFKTVYLLKPFISFENPYISWAHGVMGAHGAD